MRAVFVAVAAALLAPATAAAAEQHVVAVPGLYFDPSRLAVVVGDSVTWRVSDVQTHDVRAEDSSFASGHLGRFGGFTTRFDRAGSWPYLCSIHPFMRGQIDAFGALLTGPGGALLAGESVRLEGRAAPGTAVTLEQRSPAAANAGVVAGARHGVVVGAHSAVVAGGRHGVVVGAHSAVVAGGRRGVVAGGRRGVVAGARRGVVAGVHSAVVAGEWRVVESTVAGSDGAFAFTVRAAERAVYRPVTAAGAGPEVALDVTSRVDAVLAVRPGHRSARVVVRTRPRQPGLVASLQRYSRERFMWGGVARARLDARGRARFAVRTGGGGRVRVVLSRTKGGPPLAVTHVRRLQDGRRVHDPYRPKPPGHG